MLTSRETGIRLLDPGQQEFRAANISPNMGAGNGPFPDPTVGITSVIARICIWFPVEILFLLIVQTALERQTLVVLRERVQERSPSGRVYRRTLSFAFQREAFVECDSCSGHKG